MILDRVPRLLVLNILGNTINTKIKVHFRIGLGVRVADSVQQVSFMLPNSDREHQQWIIIEPMVEFVHRVWHFVNWENNILNSVFQDGFLSEVRSHGKLEQ
jgi:hypothetical protein